jgi:hypothetical protein
MREITEAHNGRSTNRQKAQMAEAQNTRSTKRQKVQNGRRHKTAESQNVRRHKMAEGTKWQMLQTADALHIFMYILDSNRIFNDILF